ncbi:MAG TPA: choice-of-anchor tandem repeat GloVer-containing protein [Ideonella sp.]|nr:choice-of-anchor tandem repeat GloVer-containing protein [Ideonella sp.]
MQPKTHRIATPARRAGAAATMAGLFFAGLAHAQVVTDPTPRHRQGPAGTYSVFHDFDVSLGMLRGISRPNTPLTLAADGLLYGMTWQNGRTDGKAGGGAIYRVLPTGRVQTVKVLTGRDGFDTTNNNSLTAHSDGLLYGTTMLGGAHYTGAYDGGVLFKLDPNGGYSLLWSFDCAAAIGCRPGGPLLEASDGSLYGATQTTIFRRAPDGVFSVLAPVPAWDFDAAGPRAIAPDDQIYWVNRTVNGLNAIYRVDTVSGSITVLHDFGTQSEGSELSSLMWADGLLYGTTRRGSPLGGGSLFSLSPGGEYTLLRSFPSPSSVRPMVAFKSPDGRLYGSTAGDIFLTEGDRYGSLWRVAPTGENFETLLSFAGENGDLRGERTADDLELSLLPDGRVVAPRKNGGLHDVGGLFVLTPPAPPAPAGAR